jgi:hypothetical protein
MKDPVILKRCGVTPEQLTDFKHYCKEIDRQKLEVEVVPLNDGPSDLFYTPENFDRIFSDPIERKALERRYGKLVETRNSRSLFANMFDPDAQRDTERFELFCNFKKALDGLTPLAGSPLPPSQRSSMLSIDGVAAAAQAGSSQTPRPVSSLPLSQRSSMLTLDGAGAPTGAGPSLTHAFNRLTVSTSVKSFIYGSNGELLETAVDRPASSIMMDMKPGGIVPDTPKKKKKSMRLGCCGANTED